MEKIWTQGEVIRNLYTIIKNTFGEKVVAMDELEEGLEFKGNYGATTTQMKKLFADTETKFQIKITKNERKEINTIADILEITMMKIEQQEKLIIPQNRMQQPWREMQYRQNIPLNLSRINASQIIDEQNERQQILSANFCRSR